MDETTREIEQHIDRTRDRLGSNLRELKDKVDSATDWREQFRGRPRVFMGAAVIGGVMLGTLLRGRSSARNGRNGEIGSRRAVGGGDRVLAHASDLWNNVQGALVGVAGARIKEYIGELVPGFDEHYRRAEQRTAGIDPMAP